MTLDELINLPSRTEITSTFVLLSIDTSTYETKPIHTFEFSFPFNPPSDTDEIDTTSIDSAKNIVDEFYRTHDHDQFDLIIYTPTDERLLNYPKTPMISNRMTELVLY